MNENALMTLLGLLGQGGSGALQGTDKEWVGNFGGVAANAAKNIQAAGVSKEFAEMLRNAQNPDLKGSSFTRKNADGSSLTWKMESLARDPSNYIDNIPALLQQMNAGQSPSTTMPKVGELQQPLGDLVRPFVSSPAAASAAGPSPFGMALLSPQEQMGILGQQTKTAALPTELAESRSRAAYNAMQAQKIGQGLTEKPVTTMIDGQPVTLDPSVFAQYKGQEAAREIERRKVKLEEALAPFRQKLLVDQAQAQRMDTVESRLKIQEIQRRLRAIANFRPTGKLIEDITQLVQIHPEVASTYAKSLYAGDTTRKARAIGDAWQNAYDAAMRRYAQDDQMTHLPEDERQQRAADEATAVVRAAYDDEGNPRSAIGGPLGGGPPKGKFTYWD